MAINLVSLTAQFFTPDLIGGLARMLGFNKAVTQKLVATAVPAILASLSTAADVGGAQKVSDAVSMSDPDLLTLLTRAITSGNTQFLNDGGTLLGTLIGGGGLLSLADALSQISGAPRPATQTLLGAVAHAVLGTIAVQDPSNWWDPSAIVSMLISQRSAISVAWPSEVSRALGGSRMLEGFDVASGAPGRLSYDTDTERRPIESADGLQPYARAVAKIFVNYRRDDDPGHAQSLYLRLEREFGSNNLFMDVEGRINPGDNFVEILNDEISAADIVLIVIGRRWLDLLSTRKGDSDDFNLIEIEAAIAQSKRVIPVLVGGASMPRADGLPKSIQSLARRQAVRLSIDRFGSDCVDLIAAMKESVRKT